jgi:Protein of unknown function (DUF2568)
VTSNQHAATTPAANALAATNLTVKFLLELAALALLGYWGAVVGDGFSAVLLAVAAPALMAVVWGMFAAPRATRRLPPATRVPLELGIFALAGVAGFVAGAVVASTVFLVLAALNAIGLTLFRQWAE